MPHASVRPVAGWVGMVAWWTGVALLVSCSINPAAPDMSHGLPVSPALVSAPFAAAKAPAPTAVAYVSMPPGSIAGGIKVRVRNLRDTATVGGLMAGGGFDPIAISAHVGDTLQVRVALLARDTTIGYGTVPPVSVPSIVRVSPANRQTDIAINDVIAVVFSEPMVGKTLIGAISVTTGGSAVAGTVVPSNGDTLSAIFEPAKPLTPSTTYVVGVSTAAEAQNGRTLAAPVQTSFSTTAGIVDSASCAHDCWVGHASAPPPHSSWGAAVVNGIIYNVRGLGDASGRALDAYDPATDSWTVKTPMQTPRYAPGVVALNGLVYVIGGDTTAVEAYNPTSNTWATKASLPFDVQYPGVAAMDGLLYLVSP
jgi:hypothetical protein